MDTKRFVFNEDYQKKSEDLLNLALNKVPSYKPWQKFDLGQKVSIDERYQALPCLDKEMMRKSFPAGLVPEGRNLTQALIDDEAEYTFTSGTTSDKVINIFSPDWWSAAERASWRLNSAFKGLNYPCKTAKLASSLNVGINCEEDLPMNYRLLGKTLYLSEKTNWIQMFPRHFERMIKEINEFKPEIIEANPTLLARLCNWAFDHQESLYNPKAIVFTYEFVSKTALRSIRKVLSAPCVSSYGSTETGFVLEEGDDGLMHQNTDFCRIDFIPVQARYGRKDLGRIVVSTFANPWNVIVRFEVGDLVSLPEGGASYQGWAFKAIEGRVSNLTFTPEGKLVTTRDADEALSPIVSLRDYHLEQNGPAAYELQAMVEPGTDENKAIKDLKGALERVYGPLGKYEVKIVEQIQPGPAGKFRRSQCNMAFNEKEIF